MRIYSRRSTIRMTLVVFALVGCFCLSSNLLGQSNSTPSTPRGWTKKLVKGKRPNVTFEKTGLKKNDFLAVKFYEREMLVDFDVPQWIQHRLATGAAPMKGTWTGPIEKLNRLTGNAYTAERAFSVDGRKHLLEVVAVCVDKVNVRMSATIKSITPGTKALKSEAVKLRMRVLGLEIEDAKRDKRGLSLEQNPPKIAGLKAGGQMTPGRYVGNAVIKREGESKQRFDLVIFDNGEYEFLNRKRSNTGTIEYSTASGRLQIDKPFMNDTRNWKDEYCVFGVDSKGNKIIHAETNYWKYRLTRVGDSDRVSPAEAKRQEEIAKAEAARFKHVTKQGQGINPHEIHSVIYTFNSEFRSGAMQIDYHGYLLMKDGRVHDGLPCSPDTLDLAASRSREPDAWGWWRAAKDDKKSRVEFAWPVRRNEYQMPRGTQAVAVPFKKGVQLSGDFGTVKTTTSLATQYSSINRWGIKFNKNGRFLKYRNGSTQSGGVPGMEALTTTVWDDEGSITALSGPVVGGIKRRNKNPMADRMGKYEIDGYRLTLTFDNGTIEHHATFTGESGSSIWFEGNLLSKKTSK